MNSANLSESYPPGDDDHERLVNTWRATVVNSNLYVELHTELLLLNGKTSAILAKLGIAWPPPLPAMREEADSSHDFDELAKRAEEAAAEGERRPGTDAATEVGRLFRAEEAKREARRNAARLAQIDSDALATRKARHRFWLQVGASVLAAIVGGLGVKAIEWIGIHVR